MPLCRDCEHCIPTDSVRDPFGNAKCEALTDENLVSGATLLALCGVERMPMGRCGIAGKLFTPRNGEPAGDALIPSQTVGA